MANLYKRNNIGMNICRQLATLPWRHVSVTSQITDNCCVSNKTKERGYTYPLYIYPKTTGQQSLCDISLWPPDTEQGNRTPNFNPEFIQAVEKSLGLPFNPIGTDTEPTSFTPEDIFHYIYAMLHSPTYRSRYAQFLKIDFPKIPLPTDKAAFTALGELGKKLVALHLLTAPDVTSHVTSFPQPGDNMVAKGYPSYAAPQEDKPGRIHISKDQYFEGVSQPVWDFHIGGYQVLAKWLKDRRGRQLSYQDLTHFQQIIVALLQTMDLMAEIDTVLPAFTKATGNNTNVNNQS